MLLFAWQVMRREMHRLNDTLGDTFEDYMFDVAERASEEFCGSEFWREDIEDAITNDADILIEFFERNYPERIIKEEK